MADRVYPLSESSLRLLETTVNSHEVDRLVETVRFYQGVKPGSCTWSQWDEDGDTWEPACPGAAFRLDEGTPSSNGMKFCCYCGRTIEEALWSNEEEEAPSPTPEGVDRG